MWIKKIVIVCFILITSLAYSLPVDSGDYTGSRSGSADPQEILDYYTPSNPITRDIYWDIGFSTTPGFFSYSYEFFSPRGTNNFGMEIAISDLSIQINNFKINDENGSFFLLTDAESLLDSDVIAFLPDGNSFTVSFDADRLPVWGDFLVAAFSPSQTAINAGHNQIPNELNTHLFIPVPNDIIVGTVIPEPVSISLLAPGLLFIAWKKKRR